MLKEIGKSVMSLALLLVFVTFGMGAGCSQDQGTTPQKQSTAPAPQTQIPQSAAPSAAAAPAQSPQNFAQVQVGMTTQQVQQILGNPGRTKQEKGQLEWEYYTQQGKFEVYFQNDRVVSISRH